MLMFMFMLMFSWKFRWKDRIFVHSIQLFCLQFKYVCLQEMSKPLFPYKAQPYIRDDMFLILLLLLLLLLFHETNYVVCTKRMVGIFYRLGKNEFILKSRKCSWTITLLSCSIKRAALIYGIAGRRSRRLIIGVLFLHVHVHVNVNVNVHVPMKIRAEVCIYLLH